MPATEPKSWPNFSEETGMSMRDILNVLFSQKWKIILFFSVVFSIVTLRTLKRPDIYEAEAKLLIGVTRETRAIDPLLGAGSLGQVQSERVTSEVIVLTSRRLAEMVVDEMGVQTFFAKKTSRKRTKPEEEPESSAELRTKKSIFLRLRESAIGQVLRGLSVAVEGRSYVLGLAFRSRNPLLARDALNGVISAYRRRHIEIHQAKAPLEFFQKNSELLLAGLKRAEKELEHFLKTNQIAFLRKEKETLIGLIGELQEGISDAASQMHSLQAKIATTEETLGKYPKKIELRWQKGLPNEIINAAKKRLFLLQLQEADLSFRYPDEARQLKETRAQIKVLENTLANEPETYSQTTEGINDIHQRLLLRLEIARIKYAEQAAREEQLTKILKQRKKQLADLARNQVKLDELERAVEIAAMEYSQDRKTFRRAINFMELDKAQVSNVSVIQWATMPREPSSPNRPRNIVIGFILALGGGIGLAFLLDFISDSMKTSEEVKHRLKLPVLAVVTIPEFRKCT
ncbi:MAG: hypothetical protein GY862_13630 [Gammaproteobacteria bacterium]|nr:hypothetical protein [Gammaproteobacteria bacterium]